MLEQHRCLDAGCVRDRICEVPRDERVDTASQGGGEQQPLAVCRGCIEDALHHGKEALIGHVVSLVEDADLDTVQADVAGLHVIEEASGAGDDDLDAVREGGALGSVGDPAEHGGGLDAVGGCERLDDGCDLCGELAGRDEDERPRPATHRGHGV